MTWCPRSGKEQIAGCTWLPRLLDKARRIAEPGTTDNRVGEYTFGENNPLYAQLLRFLRVSSRHVLDIVRNEPNDEAAAMRLLALSGRTPEQCRRFTGRLRAVMAPFLAMMD